MRLAWILLLLLPLINSFAQEGNNTDLLGRAEVILYSDPQEAIRIADYVFQKSDTKDQKIQAAYILTRSFYIEGKYNEALQIGLQFSEEELESQRTTHIRLHILLSKILKELELNSLSTYYSNKASSLLNSNSEKGLKYWVEGKIIQYSINKNQSGNTKAVLSQLYKVKHKLKQYSPKDVSFQIGNLNLELAEIHLRNSQLDSAKIYIAGAYRESKKTEPNNYLEMKSLIYHAKLLALKNEPAQAIDSFSSAMRIADKFENPHEQIIISRALADNYAALNNLKEFNLYNQKTNQLNTTIGTIENDAVNTAYNIFNSIETLKFEKQQAISKRNLLILAGIFLLLLIFWGLSKFRYNAKINQYQKFVDYLDKRKIVMEETVPSIKIDNVRNLNVPKEAEEILLKKLETFENSLDFTNKEISLSRLALTFETNTKYLSEVVNTNKGKNFNTYINELRINFIIDKLNHDPQYLQYKISYLAETSGFASHSVFATVFKSITGISPTTFITILRDKQESPAA